MDPNGEWDTISNILTTGEGKDWIEERLIKLDTARAIPYIKYHYWVAARWELRCVR